MKGMFLALLALWALACGGDDKKATEPAPAAGPAAAAEKRPAAEKPAAEATAPLTDADFPRVVVLFDAITRAVVDHAGDCDGMADALEKVVVEHAVTVARVRLSRDDAALNERFLAAHGSHVQAGQARMGPVLASCQSNARVMKVFTEAL